MNKAKRIAMHKKANTEKQNLINVIKKDSLIKETRFVLIEKDDCGKKRQKKLDTNSQIKNSLIIQLAHKYKTNIAVAKAAL